jgi:ATP-dependent helicase/nuclease subunit A
MTEQQATPVPPAGLLSPAILLPRELVRASAGSGKTFRISSQLIALLAAGAGGDEVFASTFTRKAAGEILDRVLARLAGGALSDAGAAKLAAEAGVSHLPGAATAAFWTVVLQRVTRQLHRVSVSTLDSFFVRAVRSFSLELGLPGEWGICDDAARLRIRQQALQTLFAGAGAEAVTRVLRAMAGGKASRSVQDAVLRRLDALLAVHHAADPDDPHLWRGFGDGDEPPVPPARVADLRDRLLAAPVPATAKGAPHSGWVKGVQSLAACLAAGDWMGVACNGLAQKVLEGKQYYNADPPAELEALVHEALVMARDQLGSRFARQGRALGALVAALAGLLHEEQCSAALFGFDDLTRLLAGAVDAGGQPLTGSAGLFYRLDGRVRHLLLDEFQDTSLAQWRALQPLADEVFGDADGARAGVIVADPKQSIYGWRGGAPELVDEVLHRYAPTEQTLDTSWRSSPVVLEVVNTVFEHLPSLSLWEDVDGADDVVSAWMRSFSRHRAQHASLPGHVRIEAGPRDDGTGQDRPRLFRRAAQRVAALRAEMPGRSIGVLTRRNATVARIMMELKRLGVDASEEGGNAVTDSDAVTSLLALLRMADHPGNRVARYHVARTAVGAAVGFTDHHSEADAHRVARDVRRRLLQQGYGRVLSRLATLVRHACTPRDARRVAQLVELAFRYDDAPTLRPSDFVRWIERQRVEDPSSADVRVMTIHQSKGLEFDIVVLPELDAPLLGSGGSPVMAYRATPVAPVSRAFPYVSSKLLPLFSHVHGLADAARQARASELRDGLSSLYVAMTRARYALHVVVRPDGPNGPATAKSGARILREALAASDEPVEDGTVIFEAGDGDWHLHAPAPAAAPVTMDAAPAAPALAPRSRRTRSLPRRTPSQLEGGGRVELAGVLRLGTAASRLRGSIVHLWFEQVGWLEDGTPDDATLARLALGIAPDMPAGDVDSLCASFRQWLQLPAIADLLSRPPTGHEATGHEAAVEREVPFLRRDGDVLLEGIIDRLVTLRRDGRVVAAHVVDYKTDAVAPGHGLEERAAHYRPQVDAYRDAVAAMYRIPREQVSACLVFLEPGVVLHL